MAFKKAGKGNYTGGAGKSYGRDKPRFNDRAGGRSFGKKPFGQRAGGPLPLFDVTCAQCGKETQVPFKPTGERPVLCRDCFKGGDGARENSPRRGSPASSSSSPSSADLREINEKLDRIMAALGIE